MQSKTNVEINPAVLVFAVLETKLEICSINCLVKYENECSLYIYAFTKFIHMYIANLVSL